MTFSELKQALLDNGRKVKTCDEYHQSSITTGYPGLIESGLPLAVWLYQSGIVTDALLAEFPGTDLNDQGVYLSNNTLTNPGKDIYIVGGTVGMSLDAENTCNIYVLKGVLNLSVAGSARGTVHSFNGAEVNITASETAVVCAVGKNETALTVELSDSAVGTFEMRGNSQAEITVNTGTHAALYGWHHSVTTYTGAGAVETYPAQAATIEPGTPV